MASRVRVARSEDIVEAGRVVVDIGGSTVGIFRVDGHLYAYENSCAHQGGPVCQGLIIPRVRELLDPSQASLGFAFDETDPHIVCPWHGFEYSIKTGRHAGKSDICLKSFEAEEEGGFVYVRV